MSGLFIGSFCVSILALLFGVWSNGYHYGVKETERRWSDAVKRAGHR